MLQFVKEFRLYCDLFTYYCLLIKQIALLGPEGVTFVHTKAKNDLEENSFLSNSVIVVPKNVSGFNALIAAKCLFSL